MIFGAQSITTDYVRAKNNVQSVSYFITQHASHQTIYFRETLIKIYTVKRTSEAELKLGEQSEKVENCWENLWNEIQLRGP